MPPSPPNDAAARLHTPQPDDPPPNEPGEPDVPPIGDPPPEPGEVPHSVKPRRRARGRASGAPDTDGGHKFCVLVTRRSKFLPAFCPQFMGPDTRL